MEFYMVSTLEMDVWFQTRQLNIFYWWVTVNIKEGYKEKKRKKIDVTRFIMKLCS
jgi:hypothetical protein